MQLNIAEGCKKIIKNQEKCKTMYIICSKSRAKNNKSVPESGQNRVENIILV